MRELQSHNCLNSISFFMLGVIIFISEFISIIMIVLLLIYTSWQYIKSVIKTLNIVCLVIKIITTLLNILMFRLGNIKKEILKIYTRKIVTPILLIIIYVIIILFNIYNAIHLSLTLHIVDYPEYGGRKRDQNYIDTHPEEFGHISVKEFIIVAICPSIICVFNFVCVIISVMFRNKIIMIYNTAHDDLYCNNNDTKNKNEKDKDKNKNKKKRNSTMMVKSTDEIANYTDTNNKKVYNNQANNDDDDEIKLPKKIKIKSKNVKFKTNDTLNDNNVDNNNDIKEYNKELPENFFFGGKEIKMADEKKNETKLNSMQGTITSMDFIKKK